MKQESTGLAIIGCGNIAGSYARALAAAPGVALLGVMDLDQNKAEALAAEHQCRVYPSLESALADEAVSIVINLTVHHAHREVTARCLEAGKHVFSEKPLAMTFAEAQDLVALAREKGVRLGCAPFTFMGEAQQTAWKWIRDGRLGKVRVAFAEVNWGRIETWHPAPEPFYEVGAVFDVGVYPLTLLTTIFGPARRVSAYGTVLLPERVTKTGQSYHLQTADFVVAVLEMADGTVVRLTSDFYVTQHTKQVGVEFHGDLGSLYLSSWAFFDASVEFAGFGQPYQRAPLLKEPRKGIPWDQGVLDLVDAINTGRPHQATGEQAAHVVEIMCATSESIQRQAPVAIHSSFMPPSPLPWALPKAGASGGYATALAFLIDQKA